jgi:hypothetical protein
MITRNCNFTLNISNSTTVTSNIPIQTLDVESLIIINYKNNSNFTVFYL